MSSEGWIKLHRKIRESAIFNDSQLLRLWLICLTEASYKAREQIVGKQVVELEPGQFVTGRFRLAEIYNSGLSSEQQIPPETLWRWIKGLEKAQFLIIKSTNKFSVVTIANWAIYQQDQPTNEQQNDQQVNNKCTTDEQQVNTNKKEKNVKNLKDSRPKRNRIYDEGSDAYILAKYLRDRILRWKPNAKVPNESPEGLMSWAEGMRKLMELDKRDKKDIQLVIQWATDDTFWQKNILSAAKLREKYDQLEGKMKQKVVRMPSTVDGDQRHKNPAYEKFDKELLKAWD
ncbi:hypothetical protein ABE137_11195 [Brevibacillus laterosporus]|uniref:hypothetical protein n=1 Tax=Brevibacillus laterosporus TaxID=1465 RepID=UPI003D208B9F